MLFKSYSRKFEEDFGLDIGGGKIHLYENGVVKKESAKLSPVNSVKVMWMDKDIRIKCAVKCEVADTTVKKRIGLQEYSSLSEDAGMFFPFRPYSDVRFHQGKVSFSLDILFLRDDEIIKIESGTKIGSKEIWSCGECTGVVEVGAGFCNKNKVAVGDCVLIYPVSKRDVREFEQEKLDVAAGKIFSEDSSLITEAFFGFDV